jgi:hypothetical protein
MQLTAIAVKQTVYNCMSPDDGRMTETCCGNNIRRGEEELLH